MGDIKLIRFRGSNKDSIAQFLHDNDIDIVLVSPWTTPPDRESGGPYHTGTPITDIYYKETKCKK